MKLIGSYVKKVTNEDDDLEITFVIKDYQSRKEAESLQKDISYRISLNEIKSKRTLEQNAYMWALIHEINTARGTERANDDWDIYLEALERAGAKYEYVAVLPQAEELLKEQFRAVKFTNQFEHHGRTFNSYKVYYGSSKMDKKEMQLLLDTVLDMAAECGVIGKVNLDE